MKKFLAIAAVVAVALTSCVKNEMATIEREITFKDFTLSSKALIHPGATAEEAFPTNLTFGAYALYHGTYEGIDTENATTQDQILVNNGEVSYKGSYWGYTTTQYWPTDKNDKLDFYAYYPYDTTVASWDRYNNCVKLTGAELGTKLNDQKDWMVATPALEKNYDNAKDGVGIVFKHISSMLVFKAIDKTPDARYQDLVTVNAISVKQAGYKGNYIENKWSSVDGRADVVVYNNDAGVAVPTTAAVDVTTATSNALIVVPEYVQNATQFVVRYSIAESADHVIAAKQGSVTINVKDLTTKWEAGNKYVYTINFDLVNGINEQLHEITFVPTVEPWNEVAGGTYDNI